MTRCSTIALIPARGGSKGIPNKNLIELAGKPLIGWSIEAARRCSAIERTVVSTDDPAIASIARAAGADVPFMRPSSLARDETAMIDVVRHAVDELAVPDDAIVVLLQPTSPFRTSEDISNAIARLVSSGARGIVSVVRCKVSPHWMLHMDTQGQISEFSPNLEKVTRRQDLEPLYRPNGAIYVVRAVVIRAGESWYGRNIIGYEMPEERSLDIDELWDLRVARALFDSKTPSS